MEPEGWIATAALVLSVFVALREWQSDRRQKRLETAHAEIQRRLAAIEEARHEEEVRARREARVVARFQRRPKDGKLQPCLVFTNEGAAAARAISFDPAFLTAGRVIGQEALPLDVLASGQEYVFPLAITDQHTPRSLPLTVTWTDDTGPREAKFTLSTV